MPVIPRFLTQAQLPKKSGLVQQDPERASFLAGEVAEKALPMAESLEAIMTKGLLTPTVRDPADLAAALDTPAPQAPTDDRPPYIANLTDAVYVTGRDRALSRQVRDILVRRATEDDDVASPKFTSGVERAVAEAQQADRADHPAGISDAALLNRERHDAAMRANAVVKAQALQEREVMDRAMAELDASADSLVMASRAGGDLETSFEEVRELGDRFTPGLGADVVEDFIANTRRELIEAHVLGLVSRGEIDAAQGLLSQYSGELPDGQAAFLERGIASGQKALDRAGKSERRQRMLLLTTRAKAGADVAWQADRLAEDGVISPAERRQVARVARESAERQAERERLIDLAGDAAAGGAPLDPGNREHRLAAELWYAAEGEALFAVLDPEARINTVAQAVSGLGHVPDDLHRDLVLDLRSADPAVVLQASREIAALREAAPAAAGAAFTDGELARAGTVIALDGHGTDTLIPDANALAPVDDPNVGPVGEAIDANTGLLILRDAFAELRRVHGNEGAWTIGDDGRFHLIDGTTGQPVLDENGAPVSAGEAQVFLIADQIARARRRGAGPTADGLQVATIRPGEDDEVLGFEVAFDRFGRPLGGGAGAGGSGASGADVLNGLLRWLVGQGGVENVEQHLEASTGGGQSGEGDDTPFVPQLSIAGLGPEDMAELSRAVDEAEARAEQDRRIVEAYQAPTLLLETFDKLREIYGGEGVWVVGADRRVYLTDGETGKPITDVDGQSISVGEAQILLVASAIARDRAGAPVLTLEGTDVAMLDKDGVVQIDLHAFDDPVFLGELGGVRPRRDGHGGSRIDELAPAMLGIGLGALLGIEGFAIIESDDADTPNGGEGDGPDDDESEEEGEGKKDIPIPVPDDTTPEDGAAVAVQGDPEGPRPIDPPPTGQTPTAEDLRRAQRLADGTADFIDRIIGTEPPTLEDLAREALREYEIFDPSQDDIEAQIEVLDIPVLDFGVDGTSPKGGRPTPHTGGTPEQRYNDTRELAKELFPWLEDLRKAGFFDQTGRSALTKIPAQTENARENILRGLAAIDALLSHPGPGVGTEISGVMYRPDLAKTTFNIGNQRVSASTSIDFLWGSQNPRKGNPYGIEHLIAKHGIEELVQVVNTIANGEIKPLEPEAGGGQSVNLKIEHEGRVAILGLLYGESGEPRTWVLTGYEKNVSQQNQPAFNISQLNRSTLLFRQETESF